MFRKHDFNDNYLIIIKGDKIVRLIRQTTAASSIKFLVGYGVDLDKVNTDDSFF
jgi:hypothetical protein